MSIDTTITAPTAQCIPTSRGMIDNNNRTVHTSSNLCVDLYLDTYLYGVPLGKLQALVKEHLPEYLV